MELRNILKFAFEARQAFRNMAVVLYPMQRFHDLGLIAVHFALDRLELPVEFCVELVDFGIERFDAVFE